MSSERPSRSWLAALRLLAAGAVVVDHAFLLAGHETPVVLAWSTRNLHLGGLAVVVFFVLSGFLVASSWLQDPDLVRFLRKRTLRIFPALVVVVAVSVLALGPALTTLPLLDYATSGGTWQYLRSAVLAPVEFHLPGVFVDNPGSDYVNGSLWTLPLELLCYCLLAIAGVLQLARRRWPVPLAAAALLAATQLVPALSATGFGDPIMFFLLGASIRLFDLPLRRRHGALAAAALAASVLTGVYTPGALALAYLILVVGTTSTGPLTRTDRWGDPSYGVYLWGYPVQQTLVTAGLTAVWPLAAVGAALALALGYASWHLVEKRAMAWGRRPAPRAAAEAPASSQPAVAHAA